MSGPRDGVAERRLAIALAGTAERRAFAAPQIQRLARVADYGWLAAGLASVRMLPLLGSRLVATVPEAVPDSFRDAVAAATSQARRRAALAEQVATLLAQRLEQAGVAVVPLKGPHLAQRLYSDPGMRTSNDIDLMVQPEDFDAAIAVLEGAGYTHARRSPWIGELPLFEASLLAGDDWRPPVDLHWRLHWYEDAFSRDFLQRSAPGRADLRAPDSLDELGALLLFWCRDGLAGLRHAADIAAWWDRHGSDLAPGAFDELAAGYPQLRRAFGAALLLGHRSVGVPANRLLTDIARPDRRTRAALRLATLVQPAAAAQSQARVVAVDALLRPERGGVAVVRRHLAPPPAVIGDIYGLPADARALRMLHRARYAVLRGGSLARGALGLLRAAPS